MPAARSNVIRSALDAGYGLPWDRAWRPVRSAGRWVLRLPFPVVFAVLLATQWATLGIIAAAAAHNGFVYYSGGDGTWYWTSAWVLGHGNVPQGFISYGYPILLAPFAHFIGPNLAAGCIAAIFVNALVLWPIALLSVYGIAKIIGGRGFAYAATLLWAVFPLLTIPYFYERYHTRLVTQDLPWALGLIPTGDFPSMVALLVGAYFALVAASRRSAEAAIIAGLATGLAAAIKPANLVFLPAPFLMFAVARRGRDLLLFSVALVPALLGLALWKYRGTGTVPIFKHQALAVALGPGLSTPPVGALSIGHYIHLDWDRLWTDYLYLREYAWSQRMVTWVLVAGVIGLFRRSTTVGLLLGGWLVSFLVLKATSVGAFQDGTFFRYLVAAFPPFFFGLAAVPLLVPVAGRRVAAVGAAAPIWPSSPVAFRRLIVVGAAVTVVPVLVFAVMRPLVAPVAARLPDVDQYVPVNSFPVRAARDGSGVLLTWPSQASAGASVGYAIFRVQQDLLDCPRLPHAAAQCVYFTEPNSLFKVTANTFATHFRDSPGAGTWTYRVAAVVGPYRKKFGDFDLLSRPVEVRVSR